ncbi:hypothetical protein BH11GEM1_BH11GEM1_13650 [soil metagenome]
MTTSTPDIAHTRTAAAPRVAEEPLSATSVVGPAGADSVRVSWRGDKRYSVSRAGAPPITLDGAREAGPGPVEILLAALAACSAIDVIDYLAKRRTPAETLDIAVEGVRNATAPRRVLSVWLVFELSGPAIGADDAERGVALAVGTYCSVVATLSPDVRVVSRLVLNGVPRGDVVQRQGAVVPP